jgi:hypothetical protein
MRAHHRANAGIGLAVLPGIADAQHAAIGRAQPAGTLNLHEKHLDWISRPAQFQPLVRQRPGVNRGAVMIRDELSAFVIAAKRLGAVGIWRRFAHLCPDKIGRQAINGDVKARLAGADTGNLGLIIAGDKSIAVANQRGLEMVGKKALGIALRPGCGAGAGGLPVRPARQAG